MKQPLRMEDITQPQVQMNLPSICVQCPYRRTLQQLLALWDQNLMKDAGINQYDQLVQQLKTQVKTRETPKKQDAEE